MNEREWGKERHWEMRGNWGREREKEGRGGEMRGKYLPNVPI